MKSVVYALKLANDKYYVGSTYDIRTTLQKIFSKKTEKEIWLKIHKPIYLHKLVYNCAHNDEYNMLLKYIKDFGIENVRGPTFDSFTHERESLREIIEKNNNISENEF